MSLLPKDHTEAPILDGIRSFHRRQMRPFTVPGHKIGKGIDHDTAVELGMSTFYNDMPILLGVDDRTDSHDYQGKAEELAADAYGADKCYFSTNGTSLSVHASMLAVANAGEKVLLVRNAHLSMVASTILTHVKPIFMEPEFDDEWDVAHGMDPAKLETYIQENPDAKGVFVVSPDYYGVCADLKTIAEVCHKHGLPLIVDEAWGTHFPFHKDLPENASRCGADLAMGSMHKTMTALGQASVLLHTGKRISQERFEKSYRLLETTSPSSLITASMDSSRRQMKLHGDALWGKTLKLAREAREKISGIEGLRVMGREVLGRPGMFDLDETKVVMDMKGLGISGFEAADWLWNEKNIAVELADHRRLMALFTVADDEESVSLLVDAMTELAAFARAKIRKSYVELPPERSLRSTLKLAPCEAYFGASESVKLEDAVGRIAAETVSPYPPGIPRVIPGELITQEIVDYLHRARDAGMFEEDAQDKKLKTIKVVKDVRH